MAEPVTEFISRNTPFKRFKARARDRCCLHPCHAVIEIGSSAFKPTKTSGGGYTPSARICDVCGQALALAQI